MRRDAVLAACFLVAAVGAARSAPEGQPAPIDPTRRALPVEGVITNPDWLSKPTGNDMAAYYPPLATALNIEGSAQIHCTVSSTGTLAGCVVTREEPKGVRFGEATLRLANLFRMKPMTVDGTPVSGGAINVPVAFRLPKSTVPEPPAPPATLPSPKALALARRIAVVTANNYVIAWKANMDRLGIGQAPLSPEESAALQAYGQSILGHEPQIADSYAQAYAKTYSEAELAGLAAFFESPAGHAWIEHQRAMAPELQAMALGVQQSAVADARVRLCQVTICPPVRAPPAAK